MDEPIICTMLLLRKRVPFSGLPRDVWRLLMRQIVKVYRDIAKKFCI